MLTTLTQLIRDVARQEILPCFLNVTLSHKQDGSPLTEADLASQQALSEGLGSLYPVPVLGEETPEGEQQQLWENRRDGLWVVDPIDGTTNFVNGLPYFAVSVAFMVEGVSQIGAVYNPMSDEMFTAVRGRGAQLNGQTLPLKTKPNPLEDAIAGADAKYLPGKLAARLACAPPCGSLRNLGSSTLEWCFLAAGRFDLYVHGGQHLWDYAAGALIAEEAGCQLASLHHADYWHTPPWKRSTVAARDAESLQQWHRWIRENL